MDITYYLTYDLPVPYKNIKIYPVKVKDYVYFSSYSQCLYLDKNSIPDPKVISMTELEYIYRATEKNPEKEPYLIWFDRLLSLCIRDEKSFENIEESVKRYNYDIRGKPFFIINKEKYTSKDFEEIRSIIADQNLVEKPDETMSKEVRDSLEKALEYKNKLAGTKPGSFEDYIISLSIATGWSLNYIYSMTIRKFIKSIRRIDNLIHYKIYLLASVAGFAKIDDKSIIKHWLSDIDSGSKYSDVSTDLNAVRETVSLESAKQ